MNNELHNSKSCRPLSARSTLHHACMQCTLTVILVAVCRHVPDVRITMAL